MTRRRRRVRGRPCCYHFVCTRPSTQFAEFLMMDGDASEVVPMFSPLFAEEPAPQRGRMRVSALERPGFGVELNPEVALERPFPAGSPSPAAAG